MVEMGAWVVGLWMYVWLVLERWTWEVIFEAVGSWRVFSCW